MSVDPNWSTLVDAATLAAMLQHPQLRLLDARAAPPTAPDPDAARRAYAQGHLPGAYYADLDHDLVDLSRPAQGRHPLPQSAAFAKRLGEWGIDPHSQVVVYDAGDGSMAAARAWWMLRLMGHRRVAVLDGGLAAWRAAGFVESTEPPAVHDGAAYPGSFDTAAIVDAAQIVERLQQAPGWLLDARAGERFRGEVEPIDPVAGHVPGAVSRPLGLSLHDGRFKPAAELRAELSALLGAHRPEQAVVMCGSGVTACHLLLALEVAGLSGARVYAGSWSGWLHDASRPVATGA
ncbi:TPA: sulfurtransferase [Xanthomonas vasicola pv. zeae]|uniref:sulfurtransferase n=1 Tax=Xanthomonas vasicola TaxID=56459 RepID=UPI00034BB982|nr:sulfurtransferase [Xanthomonas vasicola]KFA34223.1 sulfurtransferase [Xanthomonas vasicola pv. vasculorum NCPPB 206]MDO6951606.1 sulfurtransferase [Xanthomonas vasicola]HHZ21933.1 sulfurtransferase [Xanthomonas vasicola pv. zeae]HHZ25797.1 sulfurtransferase [Xanthomonas vasicola pv. zeae]HHZ33268.1 sulfurtransferase [Xanthomonas vasicola pv. zeae]